MPALYRARRSRVAFAVIATIGVATVTAYICCLKSAPGPPQPSAAVQTDVGEEPAIAEDVSLGRVLGTNNPAIPALTMPVGPPPGEDDTPDLSTPAGAVYSVLSLIDRAEAAKLAGCFVEGTAATVAGNLYPRYLGQPIELVEVVEDGQSATVIWNATVHTEFSLNGTSRSAGEMIKLTTRVVRAEDVWKLVGLHEGTENGLK